MGTKYIQIGVIAARDPEGNFLPAEPIYREATPEIEEAVLSTFADIGKVFAEKMKQYIDGGGFTPCTSDGSKADKQIEIVSTTLTQESGYAK